MQTAKISPYYLANKTRKRRSTDEQLRQLEDDSSIEFYEGSKPMSISAGRMERPRGESRDDVSTHLATALPEAPRDRIEQKIVNSWIKGGNLL